MEIYILRHGETAFNKLGIVQGSGVDTDLNDLGKAQAQAFYDYYGHLPFDMVVTSGLKRIHQTVAGFIQKNINWVQNLDINEISWGTQEGQGSTPESNALFRRVLGEWERGNFNAALPGGESAESLQIRLTRFLNWLHTRPADRLLVCSHGRTMRAMVSLMKGNSLRQMEEVKHVNTGCYIARLTDGRFHFEVENSTAHLSNVLTF